MMRIYAMRHSPTFQTPHPMTSWYYLLESIQIQFHQAVMSKIRSESFRKRLVQHVSQKQNRPKMIMHERYTTPDIISFSSSSPWVPYTSYNSHLHSHTPSFVCAPTERAHKYKHNLNREQHKNSAYTKR